MATEFTSADAYATSDDLIARYDQRTVCDLVSVDGTRVLVAGLSTNGAVLAALATASGDVESAALVGERYKPEDLEALTGNAMALLKGVVVDLAFWKLLVFKYPAIAPTEPYKGAMEWLERLRLGERLLPTEENALAGLPKTEFITQQTIDRLGLTSTLSKRYFGCRGKERRLRP